MIGIPKKGRRYATEEFELDASAFVYKDGQIIMAVESYARVRIKMLLDSALSNAKRGRFAHQSELPSSVDDISIDNVVYIPPSHEESYYPGDSCTYYQPRIRVEYSWAMSPEDLAAWKESEQKRLEAARKKKERDKVLAERRAAKEKIRVEQQTQREIANLKARAAKDPELAKLLKETLNSLSDQQS